MSARLLHPVAFVMGMLSTLAWASTGGTILFSRGDVRIVDSAGKSRPATRGADVQRGERIIAPPGTISQIRLIDGSVVGVRPDTEFKIELPPRASDRAQQVVSLLRGGVRVINVDKADGQARLPVLLQTGAGNVSLFAGDVESFYLPPGGKTAYGADSGSYTRLISGTGSVKNSASELPLPVRTVAYQPRQDIAAATTTSFSSTMFVTPVFTSPLAPSTTSGTKTAPTTTLSTSLASSSLTTSLSPTTSTLTSPTLLASPTLATSTLLAPTTPLPTASATLSRTSLTTATATLAPSPTLTQPIYQSKTFSPSPTPITYIPPPPVYVAPTITTTTIKCTLKCP